MSNWAPPLGSRSGICLCGAIRFEIHSIYDVVYCHCSKCRRWSGAPVALSANVPLADFSLTVGQPSRYRSSEQGTRHFCGTCGTHLYFSDGGPFVSINVMVLDKTADILPRLHQCVSSKLSWLEIDDDLPRYHENTLPAPGREK